MTDTAGEYFKPAPSGDERVMPIELILDVVFVLAYSQCTAYMVDRGSWLGIGDGLIVLALLWRGWVGFSWFTSALDSNSTVVRLTIFTGMGAFVMMALSIPRAFGDLAYSFVAAYAVIRLMHMGLGLLTSRRDEQFRTTVSRTAIGGVVAVALLGLGAFIDGPGGYLCWALAVVADYAIAATFSQFGWRLNAGHFAERHGLIIIIALGESILAIGVGAEVADISARTLMLSLTGVVLVACMWGTYFDGTDTAAEHALVRTPRGIKQNTLARRAYSLLHFPLVVADVLVALGLKSAIAHPDHPFEPHVTAALFGGLALYLITHVAFGYTATKVLNRPRLAVGLLMAALIPLGTVIPAWAALVLATAILAVLVAAQRLRRRAQPVADCVGGSL